ncbi:MAG: translation initiation factor IF-2 [Candidatus Aenigmarchaeota archaeon]|nr:translation initiation factor IF-2 [Candidatus Aenigmarchaeota archaeon]
MSIRSPIIVTVGHIDHGKTTLLDKIRGTVVAKGEAGGISQDIGASFIPVDTIKEISGGLLEKFKINLFIPGLLILDTPGHASFITLRKRGGSVADLAILVVDINEGFKEQTDESLTILKEFKTPFLIAATKVDRIQGWFSNSNLFHDNIEKQSDFVKEEFDKKFYNLIAQISERGFDAERFDRITDFTKQIAVVPCSGNTGEGIPELLMVLSGLSQQFLKDKLELSETARGSILEVKDVKGLGPTIDVIIYDGKINKGDYLIVGGKEPLVTKVKALLRPRALQELRVEKQFETIDSIEASAGIKISAPDLENVIAGYPILAVSSEDKIEDAKQEVQKEVEEVQFNKQIEGVTIKSDTLGGLEAMIKLLTDENVPIKKAGTGQITREDLIAAQNVADDLHKVILVFNSKITEESKTLAEEMGITIFDNQVIYRLIENYRDWCSQKKERELTEKLEQVNRPAEMVFLKGTVFRSSHPAVFGVEIERGFLKAGVLIKRADGKIIGRIKEMQKDGKTVNEVKKGDKAAISIEDVTVGRHVFEGEKLFTALSENELKILREVYNKLTDSEKEILNEI